jgi:hypothetical protein
MANNTVSPIDFFKETLAIGCTAATGKIYLSSISNLPASGYLVINQTSSALREVIHYTGTGTDGTGTYVTSDVRGVGVSSASSHDAGETVRMNYVAGVIDDIILDLDARQPLDATLTALAALNSTAGVVTQTAADTFTKRTLTGTANKVVITNGDGAAGAPTFNIGSDVVTLTDTQTLTNKTLTSPIVNTPTGITKSDVGLSNVDNTSDATKNSAVATLTNKTLTSPVINSPTGITKTDVGLGNVDNTSDATKNSAVATLTNKTLTAPVINSPTGITAGDVGLGSVTNDAQIPKSIGTTQGDIIYWTAASTPVRLAKGTANQVLAMNSGATAPEWITSSVTLPTQAGHAGEYLKTDGAALSWDAPAGSGDMILSSIQTVTGAKTFNDTKLILAGSTSGTTVLKSAAVAGSSEVTLPSGTVTLLADNGSAASLTNFPTLNQNTTGTAAKATILETARTIGGVSFDGSANITVASATGGFAITGDLNTTGARVTKGWFTDLEITNTPTVGGVAISSTYAAIAQTFYIGTTQVAINRTSAALTLAGITLTTPDIGTPSAGTLTNCTGLPISGLSASTSTAIGVGTIELGHASDTTISRTGAGAIAVEGVAIPTISSTSTLTNKRITARVTTTTDDATAVIDVDTCDQYQLSAIANNTEFTTTGTPTDGQKLIIRLKDAGVAKTLTWTGFTAVGITLPTTTVASKWIYVGAIYNSSASAWHAVAVSQEV